MSVGFETKGKVRGLWVFHFWQRGSTKNWNKTEDAFSAWSWGNKFDYNERSTEKFSIYSLVTHPHTNGGTV